MAILKGIGVTVAVNGQDLTEHEAMESPDDHETAVDSITRYIEVTTGFNFALKFTRPVIPPYGSQGLSFAVYIDGVRVQILEMLHHKIHVLEGCLSLERGSWTVQKFRFENIQFDDNHKAPDPQHQVGHPSKLGVITVKVRRIKGSKVLPQSATYLSSAGNLKPPSAISEKILKGEAVSHRTRLDQPERTPAPELGFSEYLDFLDRPYATFHFKYRSRKALQAELVIPRSPSPVPLEQRPEETLTREELLELLAQTRRSIPTNPEVPVKPEVKGKPGVRTRVKRERDPEFDEIMSSARVQKVVQKNQPVEVIDLLDD